MLLGIRYSENSFGKQWISYCKDKGIPYKIIDPRRNDIVREVSDCDAILWHYSHMNAKDYLSARQILTSLEFSGKVVFPDFYTAWHFDDKIAQKYLLESIGAPLVPTFVFYNKKQALNWVRNVTFPIVAKLRGGAGSVNVRLLKTPKRAAAYIRQAFGKGFEHSSLFPFSDLYAKYKMGKATRFDLLKSFARKFIKTEFSRVHGREVGYVYFQHFIPGNDHDIRIIVIDGKAFAIKRLVRENDFRASGSGRIEYKRELFDESLVKYSFKLADQLKSQCLAIDYVYQNGTPLIVEISFGFVQQVYEDCEGYWDRNLNWYPGKFSPQGWIIDMVVNRITNKGK
jgi:glutathione synthase/RimK-type ligase-like ATP-grasp enzyme